MNQQTKEPNVMEGLQKGAEAASKIQGAVKAGKAIAAITKGSAAGGPYGALAMAVWSNKDIVFKFIVIVCILLMLPIMFILVLPSIIFGGLDSDQLDPNLPIMNNNMGITSIITEAENIIREKLMKSHNGVIAEINGKIINLPENHIGEIKDPSGGSIFFNTALLLSQYSASKENPQEINLNDLRHTLASGLGYFYSYTENTHTEEREIPVEFSGEASQTRKATVTVHTYTVTYAGDHHFAEILGLTEEQQQLSNDYTQNLMTFLYGTTGVPGVGTATVNEAVQAYEPLIRKYAEMYGIPEYVEVIKAIMMQESGGRGDDPMQASESVSGQVGTISSAERSIDAGVKHLASCLSRAGCTSPSDIEKLKLALQGYNYGGGYITWSITKYGSYSETNALEFSNIKKAELGWERYGDPLYVQHVLRYYTSGGIGVGGAYGWGSPFVGSNWQAQITSRYGNRTDPINRKTSFHNGLDFGYPTGTPINAIKGGTVVVAGYSPSNGNYVTIDHGDGTKSMYLHCNNLSVSSGQQVSMGTVIGEVGTTGRSTGSHLHLTIYINGKAVDPINYIKP